MAIWQSTLAIRQLLEPARGGGLRVLGPGACTHHTDPHSWMSKLDAFMVLACAGRAIEAIKLVIRAGRCWKMLKSQVCLTNGETSSGEVVLALCEGKPAICH